jgi:hypothetical protein
VTEYIVTYGQGGYLGRFPSPTPVGREARVVVRTPRGLELGTILAEAGPRTMTEVAGEVIRLSTPEDEANGARLAARAQVIVADLQEHANSLGLPLLFLDGEVLLDGTQAIVQAVHWADCDASSLFEQLSSRHGLAIKLADLTTTPQKAGGCATCGSEKSGCSSCGTGGGCSTGSCSSGAVKSADELTEYFAGLRRQMETAALRVSLH